MIPTNSWRGWTLLILLTFPAAGLREALASNSLSSGDITKSSGSPLDGSTPGNKCKSCHSYTTLSSNSASVTLTGITGTAWSASMPYAMTLTVPLGAAGQGFLLTAENATAKQGAYTNLNATTEKLITTGELGHQNAVRSTVRSWNFTWTSPAAGAGQICFYVYALSDSNTTSGNAYFNSWCYAEAAAAPPAITTQPANQTVTEGQTASFSVVATGGGLFYQWQKAPSGSTTYAAITAATSTSYTTPATTVAADNGSSFRCVITNTGGSVTSSAATLTVNPAAPSITAQPVPQAVLIGATATFSVTASGTAPLSYQWQKAPSGSTTFAAIAGATSAGYTTPATTTTDNGSSFRCVVSNAAGSATSNPATMSVTATATPPAITVQPAPQTALAGQTATFSVAASGTAPLSWQWQKAPSGSVTYAAIAGATFASYTTPGVTTADNGSNFRCVASNSAGTATSNAATLSVSAVIAPTIAIPPAAMTVSEGQTAAFSLTAGGTPPLNYQWQKAPPGSTIYAAIAGATSASYTTPATVAAADNGSSFECVVSNTAGSVTSPPALLTVNPVGVTGPPVITVQPQNPTRVPLGQSANFSVTVANPSDPTLLYQWFRNGQAISLNALDSSYTIPVVMMADSGAYFYCLVTNALGSITSSQAKLMAANALEAPQIGNYQPVMSLGDPLQISTQYSVPVTYNWTFTYTGPPAGAASPAATGSGRAVQMATPAVSLVPAALNLTPGTYQVSVQATDSFGDASSPTTENVTFLASDLSGAGVYPNPWRADRSAHPYITFTGLTMNASVKIFTVAGELVKRLDASGDSAQWFLTNDSGDKVASGLYIYLLTDSQGNKKRGKLAVIR